MGTGEVVEEYKPGSEWERRECGGEKGGVEFDSGSDIQ